MMTRDILVAVDHSDGARKAFDYAVQFIAHKGEDSSDILHLVHYVKNRDRRSAWYLLSLFRILCFVAILNSVWQSSSDLRPHCDTRGKHSDIRITYLFVLSHVQRVRRVCEVWRGGWPGIECFRRFHNFYISSLCVIDFVVQIFEIVYTVAHYFEILPSRVMHHVPTRCATLYTRSNSMELPFCTNTPQNTSPQVCGGAGVLRYLSKEWEEAIFRHAKGLLLPPICYT